jgi:hypothetical protein
MPTETSFTSENARYILQVSPEKPKFSGSRNPTLIEDRFSPSVHEDKAASTEISTSPIGLTIPGDPNTAENEPEKEGPALAKLFFVDENSNKSLIWERNLVNPMFPVKCKIADSGKFVATFDDWGSLGYKNAVVVYGEEGKFIKSFALEDILSKSEISVLPVSISSRPWLSFAKFEENEGETWLIVATYAGEKRINLDKLMLEGACFK